tara:strand:- start:187 stop:504 length:318 start_codon:yes stop_codon:yes gene_type:complete
MKKKEKKWYLNSIVMSNIQNATRPSMYYSNEKNPNSIYARNKQNSKVKRGFKIIEKPKNKLNKGLQNKETRLDPTESKNNMVGGANIRPKKEVGYNVGLPVKGKK